MSNNTEITPEPTKTDSYQLVVKIFRRVLSSLFILVMISLLTLAGLYLAQRGRQGLPVEPLSALRTIFGQLFNYLTDHPRSYIWHKVEVPVFTLVLDLFKNSAGLLAVSLLMASLAGTVAGILAAVTRRKVIAPLMLVVSILGVSTPSFLLAMFLWIISLNISRATGWFEPLPPTGLGWDAHLILPALVLAARPFAQIMQVTYVNMTNILDQDFIRAAQARGGSKLYLIRVHALRNILIPVLTTLTTSLRFSLSSLPVIETFFLWPGLGLAILQAITLNMPTLVTDLTTSLGLLFLLLNFLLDFIYPLIDPRLRTEDLSLKMETSPTLQEWVGKVRSVFSSFAAGISAFLFRLKKKQRVDKPTEKESFGESRGNIRYETLPANTDRYLNLRAALTNLPLILGCLTFIGLVVLALWGAQMTTASPYSYRNVMLIGGKVFGPPFQPSTPFPWGSDTLGRDMQALVLAGARQTLALAFLAVVARLLLGTVLGLVSGWWQGSWFDRLVQGLTAVWSAFPVTVFTALLILGLGIQRGISVFIIALCLVGWSEITQYVRSQVIVQKPSLYIEAARSFGASSTRILIHHILPHLLTVMLVMAALEMAGVLMLLAELGFLNIFLGGGFRVETASEAILSFSDVPEWGALLANIRTLWRSYPWVAWSPGLAFFLSILGFNLLGEGLRHFLEESRVSISRLINKYSLLVLSAFIVGIYFLVQTSAPVVLYRPQAQTFDAARAYQDIERLASPQMAGRESGTAAQRQAAEYIANRMAEIGLFPANSRETFIQEMYNTNYHLTDIPTLKIMDGQGQVVETLAYRKDYVEFLSLPIPGYGQGQGQAQGLIIGNGPSNLKSSMRDMDLKDKVIIVRTEDIDHLPLPSVAGLLVISDSPDFLDRRFLSTSSADPAFPILLITPALGDRLLKSAGSSLAEFDSLRKDASPNQLSTTRAGDSVSIWFPFEPIDLKETCQNVIGYIPGIGSHMGERKGAGLDNHVILLAAHYDGLGIGPDGTLYPGANDNASGVAILLELARVLKNAEHQPKKTVVFAAWCGGERNEGLSVFNVMNAKPGFSQMEVEAVLELIGLGQGSGKGIALGDGTSYRLVKLIEKAAGTLGVSVTTRGRGAHFDFPSGSGFGGRKTLSAYFSWDGSDVLAHTTQDQVGVIDLKKLQKSGELVGLVASVLSLETNY